MPQDPLDALQNEFNLDWVATCPCWIW